MLMIRGRLRRRYKAYPENDDSPKPLPLQGYCGTVYDTASLLVKRCVELKCFDEGLLAVQLVFDYSKERVIRYERNVSCSEREQKPAMQNNG
jgi:hypothetical protein